MAQPEDKSSELVSKNFFDSLRKHSSDDANPEDDIDYEDIQNMPGLIL